MCFCPENILRGITYTFIISMGIYGKSHNFNRESGKTISVRIAAYVIFRICARIYKGKIIRRTLSK